jgi:hypothetical protein
VLSLQHDWPGICSSHEYLVSYQNLVVKRVKLSIHHPNQLQGCKLTRQPFQSPWFSNQLAVYVSNHSLASSFVADCYESCLSLWQHDRTLYCLMRWSWPRPFSCRLTVSMFFGPVRVSWSFTCAIYKLYSIAPFRSPSISVRQSPSQTRRCMYCRRDVPSVTHIPFFTSILQDTVIY